MTIGREREAMGYYDKIQKDKIRKEMLEKQQRQRKTLPLRTCAVCGTDSPLNRLCQYCKKRFCGFHSKPRKGGELNRFHPGHICSGLA